MELTVDEDDDMEPFPAGEISLHRLLKGDEALMAMEAYRRELEEDSKELQDQVGDTVEIEPDGEDDISIETHHAFICIEYSFDINNDVSKTVECRVEGLTSPSSDDEFWGAPVTVLERYGQNPDGPPPEEDDNDEIKFTDFLDRADINNLAVFARALRVVRAQNIIKHEFGHEE